MIFVIIMMLENVLLLLVKVVGGVKFYKDVIEMIYLGVKWIGILFVKVIVNGENILN